MRLMFTKDFKQLSKEDTAIAGGKGASLGEMTNAGIPVPPGFVVLASAFDRFLEETDLNAEIEARLKKVNLKDINSVGRASNEIRDLILDVKLPKDIAKEIQKEFLKLKAGRVAVRSSATAEDSSVASWAGELESYLNTIKTDLLENVKKCWASLFTPRAIFYRFEKKLQKTKVSVAVVVQKMVQSEISGIAFTVHPVTEDFNQMVIEAGYGLGEAIVGGKITPDTYVVHKKDLSILDKNVSKQKIMIVRKEKGGVEEIEVPELKQGKPFDSTQGKQKLADKKIIKIAKICRQIEKHYGKPQDIEWAFEKGKFYIVQSRPITTLEKEVKKIFTKEHSREYSLFRVHTLSSIMGEILPKMIGEGAAEACSVYRGGDLVSVYYESEYIKRLFSKVAQKCQDIEYIKKEIGKFLKIFERLKPYFIEERKPRNTEELKKILNLYTELWAYIAIIWIIPTLPVDDKIKKLALKARETTQEYNETIELIIKEFLEKNYPFLKNKTRFILPEEVWSEEVKNKDIKEKITEREKGFVFYKGNLYSGNIDKTLDGLGITLEDKKSSISGEVEQKEGKIKGQIAFKGKVKGKVKIVSSVKDLPKVEEGDILVAAMTMPKYLPAMKKASAFITDEGGITCHAAIVSREMQKPCIIGTKIATQVLKDGDLVEVDAEKGIVKILRK